MKIINNYGDVTKIKVGEVPLVDIITYGAPCQDISIAGRRAGMKNTIMGDEESTRSGLFFDAIRIVKEMRNESIKRLSSGGSTFDIRCVQPRYTIYENVPGCFSSNNGEDFRTVLEETIKVVDENAYVPQLEKGQKWATAGCIVGDGYSVAWRLHDAQFWGVPQRRKRICVLADYGGVQRQKYYLNLSEKPMMPKPSRLSQILERNPNSKYKLSVTACQGILNRASKRGKALPKLLQIALETQAATPSKLGGALTLIPTESEQEKVL